MEPHEHFNYATVSACYEIVDNQLYKLRHEFEDAVSSIDVSEVVLSRLNYLDDKISWIKDALIEIQDSLRSLGMGDMSERLGDLDVLLG